MSEGRQRSALRLLGLLAAGYALCAPSERRVGRPAFAAFNTVCAQCHEAECSGRLSFHGGAAAAREHVRRYAGPVPDPQVEDLFALLQYTKQECGIYPLEPATQPGGTWSAAALRDFYEPNARAYFVPLGALGRGACRLRLGLDADAEVSLSITNARFEVAHEGTARSRERRIEVGWACPGAGPSFLRVRVAGTAQLESLGVEDGASSQ